jgi:7-cyano-7-deazaguanine synthase
VAVGTQVRERRGDSVALVSGGLDSVVAAAVVASRGMLLSIITVDYGQKAATREIAAGRAVARTMGVPWHRIDLPWLAKLLPVSLAKGDGRAPQVAAGHLDDPASAAARARAVWVPNRNGVLLNVAASFAEASRALFVVAGFNKEEAATFPDNSQEYMKRLDAAFALSTLNGVRVVSPTAKLDKTGIVTLGMKCGAPLHLVWSCYGAGRKMCMRCESCQRLVRALRAANAPARNWPKALRARA